MFIQELNAVLLKGEDLPTLPDVVLRLHAALDDDNTSDAQVAEVLEGDPALTTRLLRVANSSAYTRGTPVTSVLGAIQRVGLRQLRALSLALAVVKIFTAGKDGLSHHEFWDHSALVGRIAQWLARRLKNLGELRADDLYVAGLLHDVGILVLDQFFHEKLRELMEVRELSGDPVTACEELVLGMDHGEIGGLLLGRWSLPESIVTCVSHHHRPETAPETYRQGARVVHAAEVLAAAHGGAVAFEGELGDPMPSLSAIGLEDAYDDLAQELADLTQDARGLLAA